VWFIVYDISIIRHFGNLLSYHSHVFTHFTPLPVYGSDQRLRASLPQPLGVALAGSRRRGTADSGRTAHMSVPPEIRAPLEWVFNALDSDGSGYIERQEGLITAKYLGAADKGEYWDMMLKEMDSDGDGKISKEEYVLWMFEKKAMRRELAEQLKEEIALKLNQHKALAAAASAPVDDLDIEEIPMDGSVAVAAPAAPAGKGLALQAKFKALDLDGDGSITKEELQDFHAMLSEDQIAKLFAKADKDGSNSITFDEFCAVVEAFEEAAKAEEAAMDGLLPE